MSAKLNELRLQLERLDYDNKESVITIDILKEQNADAKNELEELKKTIAELRSSQKDMSADDKEKRKQEKMALMMAQFDTVSCLHRGHRHTEDVLTMWISFSKEHSLRRMSSFARSLRNSILSIPRAMYLPLLWMISPRSEGSLPRDSHLFVKLSIVYDRSRRRVT